MLHGTVRTKKVVANTFSGFQPLSEIENSKISQLKNFMEDTTGGDLLFRILINNLKSYEKENSLMENSLWGFCEYYTPNFKRRRSMGLVYATYTWRKKK
jgi:hypothetical protein